MIDRAIHFCYVMIIKFIYKHKWELMSKFKVDQLTNSNGTIIFSSQPKTAVSPNIKALQLDWLSQNDNITKCWNFCLNVIFTNNKQFKYHSYLINIIANAEIFTSQIQIKINQIFHYTRCITPKRITSLCIASVQPNSLPNN